jgi:ribosome-binding protein aMBF1 (putative translation factor)
MSQEMLAVKLGVDETTVAKWERDEHQPVKKSAEIVKGFFGSVPFKCVQSGRFPPESTLNSDGRI